MENCPDLNLAKDLSTFRSFHFPDSGPYLLNGFDITGNFIFNGMTVKTGHSPVRVQLIKTDNCKPTDKWITAN